MVRSGLHILDQPGAADSPVKYPIPLNVTRLMGDLENVGKTWGSKREFVYMSNQIKTGRA